MSNYQSAYVTLSEIITQLDKIEVTDINNPTATTTAVINAQDGNIKAHFERLIYEVSDDLKNQWWRVFVPFVDTLTVRATSQAWKNAWYATPDTYVFDLSYLENRDLLSVDSVTLDGTSILSAYYYLDDSDGYPAQKIVFDRDNVTFPTSPTFNTSLVITGTWGYHENPARMWLASGDTVQNNPLAISDTVLNVSNGSNFEILQYIKIEDEFLLITGIASNALTVERGVNGTTATSHVLNTAIYIYNQTDSIRREVRRMVIRHFMTRNGYELVAGSAVGGSTYGNDAFNLPISKRWGLGTV